MKRTTLITGGAGFVGTNMADRLLSEGRHVVILDDLSRPGVDANLRRLSDAHPGSRLRVEIGDVRDPAVVRRALVGAETVFHFAAQVAVTTSVSDPVHDFQVNLLGTLNVLEEIRRLIDPPTLLFTSTNKVYGDLCDVALERRDDRWEPTNASLRRRGVGESRPLAFCSPYGCSKGGADQYVLDYAKSYDLPTLVFRMSCIYGEHQCGSEDQGWVAHFLLRAMRRETVTLFGDGRQVRDILHVSDLLDAMLTAVARIDQLAGSAFNMGGGSSNTVSLLEILDLIAALEGRRPRVEFGPARIGDQRWYVSDSSAFRNATGWAPRVTVDEGVGQLHAWLRANADVAVAEAV
jgi:CDP-paratose 2-epimerase